MISSILLQAAGGGSMQMIFLFGMLAVMYLFIFLPQSRKQKKQKQFVQDLKKGDQVVTLGGMHGKIVGLDEHTILLEVDRGINIRFERASISMENTQALQEAKPEKAKS